MIKKEYVFFRVPRTTKGNDKMANYEKFYSEWKKINEFLLGLTILEKEKLDINELNKLGKRRAELEKQLAKF
jgi:hypothetical protein